MNGYMTAINGTSVLPAHSISSGQNSLQGALKTGPEPMKRKLSTTSKSPHLSAQTSVAEAKAKAASTAGVNASLDQDMQRQLADYNRSVTVVVWYRSNAEPIRLQHMNPTFPYFQLLQLEMLVTDLALSPNSSIDTFDPLSGTWEQHNMNTVRIVGTQQRLLYKIRRSLLDGLSESECPGLPEEVASQNTAQKQASPALQTQQLSISTPVSIRKRSAPDDTSPEVPAPKTHVPNHYYSAQAAPPTTLPRIPTAVSEPIDVMYVSGSYPSYTPQMYYPTSTSTSAPAPTPAAPVHAPSSVSVGPSASTSATAPIPDPSPPPASPDSSALSNAIEPGPSSSSASMPPAPSQPHSPLKRWPNDYTVLELTEGFRAMEALVQNGSSGGRNGTGTGAGAGTGGTGGMTQRAAFERVFGTRYVKSTVCRHRGLWRKAAGPLREQFERMGTDERACWNEFVRRVEGRPPGKAAGAGAGQAQVQMRMQSVGGVYPRPTAATVANGNLVIVGGTETHASTEVAAPEEPVMASLQAPDGQGTAGFG